ncbi:apolipoprotein N-acyltransferase [Psychromonas sp. SA13A]|uniref:apolipoprotein N-acyltransferase n=1 Tax=Psychromonas sp. SA13A TaxID=2686346 RepID=UPI00140D54A1|nr:apolipoprotein N-acyltransferase [Psychromonas sp. SA13A]
MKKSLSKLQGKIISSLAAQLIIAVLLGAIQVFAFAPFQQWWVLYPSFVGLFLLLQQTQLVNKKLFLVCFSFNLSMFIATMHWIYVSMDLFGGMPSIVSGLLIVVLCAYLALFPTLALWLSYKIKLPENSSAIRLLLILPSLWLLTDWLRGWVLTGMPWAYLGYSHADTPLAGFAPIFGVQGITLAVMLICCALTLILIKQFQRLSCLLIIFLVSSGYALKQLTFTELQPAVNVALVQGNIDQNEKWKADQLYPSLFKYLDLSKASSKLISPATNKNSPDTIPQKSNQAQTNDNELIIWPESAIAGLEIDMQRFLQPLSKELALQGKTLLTGIINYNIRENEYFNTIIMLGKLPEGQGYSPISPNRYNKHHLLPIGEFVPFEDILRPLAPYFNLPMSSFNRGPEVQKNLSFEQTTLAPSLCYEIAFPELLRKNVGIETGMIITLSNDAWFGHSIGPAQHLEIARMRAIELGRPLLRSTNNGITAIYDSKGNELGRLPSNTAAVLRRSIQPAYGQTPYQKMGQIPLFIFCFFALLSAFILNKRQTA